MRKVDSELIAALRQHKPTFSKGNRMIRYVYNEDTNETIPEVYFHGHRIATFMPSCVMISNCGYYTVTTKSILSTLLWEFCRAHLYQHKWEWYVQQGDQKREYDHNMMISYAD